ncbi:hypothetical protein QZH41_008595 [Actinostola sp. cb2023]|nr:hypothetical protein QZH41_008595 [Actinostola sp. cb2023]
MDDRHRSLLRRHTLSFRRDLEPKKLLPYLVSVLDTNDEQEIKNQPTREDQVDRLLDILPRRGPRAFPCFIEALDDVQPFLAVPLREEEEMEKKLIEMKTELGRARSHSAKLRDELRIVSVSLESQKNKQENIRKELEELKSLHKALLNQSKTEKEKLIFNVNELNNIKEKLTRELETEKQLKTDLQNKCRTFEKELNDKTTEITDLKLEFQRHLQHETMRDIAQSNSRKAYPVDSRKLSFDETKSRAKHDMQRKRAYSEKIISNNGENEIAEDIDKTSRHCVNNNMEVLYGQCEEMLECIQHNAELVELERKLDLVTCERDFALATSKELEHQLKAYEEKKKNQLDKSTTTMEDIGISTCRKCTNLQSDCVEAKQQMEREVSSLKQETRTLECRLKEKTDKFDREKRSLETNLCKLEELYNTSKQDHDNEVKNIRNEMTELHYNEIKDLKNTKDDLTSQIERDKHNISRLRSELDKERDTNKTIHKDFDKFKKKTNSEKKQLKQKLEQEIKAKSASLKEFESELKDAKDCEQIRLDEISKLKTTVRGKEEIHEQLMEDLSRWKTLPGRVFNYKKDFDRNGIIYTMGTNFNTTQFVNPASNDNGRILVSRSSCHHGHPIDILDPRKGTLSCTCDIEDSWWSVDIGEEYALFVTHYTIRHGRDNGLSIIRNWNLEGSRDGRNWKVLRKHENDRGLKGVYPFYTGTWTVEGNIQAMRYFRIHQTGKNSSGRYALYLSGFEIYGVLLNMR